MPVISNLIGSAHAGANNTGNKSLTKGLFHNTIADVTVLSNNTTNLMSSIDVSYAISSDAGIVYCATTGIIQARDLRTGAEYNINLPETGEINNGANIVFANGVLHWMGGQPSPESQLLENRYNTRHYIYDGANWIKKIGLPKQFWYSGTTVFNGELYYISSGSYLDGNNSSKEDHYFRPQVFKYNYSNDTWSQIGDLFRDYTGNLHIYGPSCIYNDGEYLYVGIHFSHFRDTTKRIQFRYEPTIDTWVRMGYCINDSYAHNDVKFGSINNDIYAVDSNSFWKVEGGKYEETELFESFASYKFFGFIDESLYALQYNTATNHTVVKIRLVDVMMCPKGSILHTNDTSVNRFADGTKFEKDTLVRILHRSDIYYTVSLGDDILYFDADTVNHRAYLLKGTTFNNTVVSNTGLQQINTLDKRYILK